MEVPSSDNTSVIADELYSKLKPCFFTDSVAARICKALAYCAVLLISLVGNTSLVFIICKRKEFLRTVNYFIVNMAIYDFVFPLVGIPIKITQIMSHSFHWHVSGAAGSILCKVYRFFSVASLTVSLQSIVWIAIDRFVAVMFPMKVRIISSKFRAIAIASTWIVALAVRSPNLMTVSLAEYENVISVVIGALPRFLKVKLL